jgi:hypothetical protein
VLAQRVDPKASARGCRHDLSEGVGVVDTVADARRGAGAGTGIGLGLGLGLVEVMRPAECVGNVSVQWFGGVHHQEQWVEVDEEEAPHRVAAST